MKKRFRFIAAVLAFIICVVPVTAVADETFDVTLYNNVTINCTILEDTNFYCKFVPAEDGIYTFASLSEDPSADLDAVLYCGDDFLVRDTDSGEYYNFKLTYPLSKGVTYTLCIYSYWGSSTVTCPIKVTTAQKDYPTLSPEVLTLDTPTVLVQDTLEHFYEFTPETDGYYNFSSKNCEGADTSAILYEVIDDCLVFVDVSDDSALGLDFSLTLKLKANVKYVLKAMSLHVGNDASVTVSQNAGELEALNPLPVTVGENELSLSDSVAYAFTPSQSADYTFIDSACEGFEVYKHLAGALVLVDYYVGYGFVMTLEEDVTYVLLYPDDFENENTTLTISLGGEVFTDFTVDEENSLILGVFAEMTAEEFKDYFSGDVEVFDINGNLLRDFDTVTTGSTVLLNGSSYSVVIKGDVNGDGKVNSTDFMQVRRSFLGLYTMNDVNFTAGDTNGDGTLSSVDFMRIRSHYLGRYDLFA